MARKLPGLRRELDARALFSVAYGEIASSIYFALGIVALHAVGFTPLVLLGAGALFLLVALSYAEATSALPETGGAATFVRRASNDLAGFLTHTVETHRSYPVLRYFHFRQERYALPQMLLVALDAAALVSSALDPDRYHGLIGSPTVFELSMAGQELLGELGPHVREETPTAEVARRWEQHFGDAVAQLRGAGLQVAPDLHAATEKYCALRSRWDAPLRALTRAMVYEWDEIEHAG